MHSSSNGPSAIDSPSPRRLPHGYRRGAAAVEFAFTFTILLLLVMVTIEFSRVSMLRHAADNAAYEGARNAIVPGATAQDAVDAAHDLLARAGVRFANVTVTPETIQEKTTQVRVRVDVPVTPNSWVIPRFLNGSTMSSDVTLITERTPLIQLRGLPKPPPPPAPPAPPTPPSPPPPTAPGPPPPPTSPPPPPPPPSPPSPPPPPPPPPPML